jgi:hypothetical protein
MTTEALVHTWFKIWEDGNFEDLPISDDFTHISPYGNITRKANYLNLVTANKDQFLGHTFELLDTIFQENKACIRYIAHHKDSKLEVTEWHYINNEKINKVVAYYNIETERIEKY